MSSAGSTSGPISRARPRRPRSPSASCSTPGGQAGRVPARDRVADRLRAGEHVGERAVVGLRRRRGHRVVADPVHLRLRGARSSVARPSAAPHIACRSSFAAAAPRSPPAAWISTSALPRITIASTTPPGHGVGVGPTAAVARRGRAGRRRRRQRRTAMARPSGAGRRPAGGDEQARRAARWRRAAPAGRGALRRATGVTRPRRPPRRSPASRPRPGQPSSG